MKNEILKKIVSAITINILDVIDMASLSKISVDWDIAHENGLISQIENCFYITTDYKNDIIVNLTGKEINVFKTVKENNKVLGYKFVTYQTITNRTQINITAELFANILSAIEICKREV